MRVPLAVGWEKRVARLLCIPPIAFIVTVAIFSLARGRRGSHPQLPVSQPPVGTSGAEGHAAPGTQTPFKAFWGSFCGMPGSPCSWDRLVVGWEEDASCAQLSGAGLGSAERVPGTAASCGESRRGWSVIQNQMVFGVAASPVTSPSSLLRHQTFTNPRAGTFPVFDVLFWFVSNLSPVDTAAALLKLSGPEQG